MKMKRIPVVLIREWVSLNWIDRLKWISKGVCCGSNGSQCCPFKYICNDEHLTCQLNQTKENRCGLSKLICQPNETCCSTSQINPDEFACCPFTNVCLFIFINWISCWIYLKGICCEDGKHCCPQNSKCSLRSGGCISLSN